MQRHDNIFLTQLYAPPILTNCQTQYTKFWRVHEWNIAKHSSFLVKLNIWTQCIHVSKLHVKHLSLEEKHQVFQTFSSSYQNYIYIYIFFLIFYFSEETHFLFIWALPDPTTAEQPRYRTIFSPQSPVQINTSESLISIYIFFNQLEPRSSPYPFSKRVSFLRLFTWF